MAVSPPNEIAVTTVGEGHIKVVWLYAPNGGQTGTRLQWLRVEDGEPVGERDVVMALKNYQIEGLVPGTKYRICAFGLKNDEVSVYSRDVEATTQPATSPPASPTNLTADATKDDMELIWSGPENATNYKISFGLDPSGPVIRTETSTRTTHIVSGLNEGTLYYFDVQSSNNFGDSAPTRVVKQTLQPPAMPTNLQATPAITTMLLRWTGSAQASSYVIRYGVEPGGAPIVLSATSTEKTVEQLTKNTPYYFEVSAANGNGESRPARIVKNTLDGPPLPLRPAALHLVSVHHWIKAIWSNPTSPRYRVSLLDEQYEQIKTEITAYTTYEFKDLPPQTLFHVEVRGVNDSGESPPTRNSILTKAFEAPYQLRRSKLDYESVVFQWLDNIHDPQDMRYETYLNGTQLDTISEQRTLLSGLNSDTQYEFKVRAKSAAGYFSEFATHSFKTPPFTGWLICSPGYLKGKRLSATTAELDWEMPYETCEICPDAVGFEISGEGISTFEVLRPPCEVKGLNAERFYEFSVRAKATGSNISKPSRVKIGAYPGKAGALQVSNITKRSATATWAAAKGIVSVSEYIVYLNGIYIGSARQLEYQIDELEPNTKYRVEVRARAGGSGLSEPVGQEFTTLEDDNLVPNPPTDLRFKREGLAVVIEWNPPLDGPFLHRYYIELISAVGTLQYDSFQPKIYPILLPAYYKVFVWAVNAAGKSDPLIAEMVVRNVEEERRN
ncbi:fibronectin type III domain-containing protein [Pseudomonas sp. C1C7]|uniref:fibronectin type III domain-containing protein n=1 Tax=Pseudomonas sp. C1C7 TaxID=2735272 RepID=UPI001585EF0F|nr:fibronectin type III domain-containing protein [Pseudomonas sp. C1C7]NUT76718.1 fibronectin type III domain-containing protein [Pseudomonas sp. C1C7]